MASADARLKLDTDSRLVFANSPLGAFVFTLIAAGFAYLCWRFIGDESIARYAFTGFAMLFVIVGIIGIFWRLELDIDLLGRSVRITRGLWPKPAETVRSLDEATGIRLTLEYRSAGSKGERREPWWFVGLHFPDDDDQGFRLYATSSEVDAYRHWERYAKRLQVDAIDATTSEESRRSFRELDQNIAAAGRSNGAAPVHVGSLPAGSRLKLLYEGSRKEIMLPAPGFNGGLVFLVLFGGAFVAIGVFVGLAVAGVLDVDVAGSPTVKMIIPPLFVFMGLGVMWLGVRGSFSAWVIGVDNGSLFAERRVFGRRSGRQDIPLAAIESIAIGGDVGSRRQSGAKVALGGVNLGSRKYRERQNELVVRSDERILRFGANLDEPDQLWLEGACRFAAANGQFP